MYCINSNRLWLNGKVLVASWSQKETRKIKEQRIDRIDIDRIDMTRVSILSAGANGNNLPRKRNSFLARPVVRRKPV